MSPCERRADTVHCLGRLLEWTSWIWDASDAVVPESILALDLWMGFDFEAKNPQGGDDDDKIGLAFYLAHMVRDVQRVNHNPVFAERFITQPFVDFTCALAGGVGSQDGRDHPCHRSGSTANGLPSRPIGTRIASGDFCSTLNAVIVPP